MVSLDRQHTRKVYSCINTMDLFGPATYGEGFSCINTMVSLDRRHTGKVYSCINTMVSLDRRHTGKVYSCINTMDLFGPATYGEGLFVH